MSAADIAADLDADIAASADVVAAVIRLDAALAAAQPGGEGTNNNTPPSQLASMIESLEEELDLKKHRKNVNKLGPGGATPLLVACLQGNVADVGALLRFGADPTVEGEVWNIFEDGIETNKLKQTPLGLAARDGHGAIVELLLEREEVAVNEGTTDRGAIPLFGACSSTL